MSKRKKDEYKDTYISEGIIFGMLIGTVLSVLINNFDADAFWTWAISPGYGMLVGSTSWHEY